jgi:hypothetical protein
VKVLRVFGYGTLLAAIVRQDIGDLVREPLEFQDYSALEIAELQRSEWS